MLKDKNMQLSFYSLLYFKIPENHTLKLIKDEVDFSFINQLLEDSYCKYYGRPAKEPELMIKLLVLKYLYKLSDVRVIEDASLKNCGGFTIHRGKGGWIDPAGKAIKEEVAILMVSGSYASIEAIAAIGKRMLDHTAIYVKKPDGSTILL